MIMHAKKKVVQIATGDIGGHFYLVALCSDGSIWLRDLIDVQWRDISLPEGCSTDEYLETKK